MIRSTLINISLVLTSTVFSQQGIPPQGLGGAEDPAKLTQGLGIDQKLGEQVPPNIFFKDENGQQVAIGDYFGKTPILLVPVFYNCNSACILTMDESLKSFIKLRTVKFRLGKDYQVLFFSLHPKETPELAMIKKKQLLELYQNKEAKTVDRHEGKQLIEKDQVYSEKDPTISEQGMHLLTGTQESIQKLTQAIGFHYKYDEIKDQIQHPAGSMVLMPQGRISKVFYGSMFEPKLLKDSLQQATGNAIGQKSEPLLFGCIHIDPITGQKSLVFINVIRLLGTIVLIGLVAFILISNRQQKRLKAEHHQGVDS